ncbi:MAG: TIGR02217 family protein [Rhizobiales bacterium]|nr:TIGR02217 family protein [Hyphomicrobiales bacterium]
MAFHDTRFPLGIALGARGGPERRTDIVTLGSGFEERNSAWADSRRQYNAGYGLRGLDDIHALIAFFEARHGRLHGFRWRDRADWKSCAPSATPQADDQLIGTGDGTQAAFQLTKTYMSGPASYVRMITKPVAGSVLLAVDGVATSAFTLDAVTGLVTFDVGAIPASGALVSAGYEFDVPVRFDTDRLEIDLSAFTAGAVPDIPVIEIRV